MTKHAGIAQRESVGERRMDECPPSRRSQVSSPAPRSIPSEPDFTAHRHPVLAVPCADCGARAGAWCKRPSGHKAMDLHSAADVHWDPRHLACMGIGDIELGEEEAA